MLEIFRGFRKKCEKSHLFHFSPCLFIFSLFNLIIHYLIRIYYYTTTILQRILQSYNNYYNFIVVLCCIVLCGVL